MSATSLMSLGYNEVPHPALFAASDHSASHDVVSDLRIAIDWRIDGTRAPTWDDAETEEWVIERLGSARVRHPVRLRARGR